MRRLSMMALNNPTTAVAAINTTTNQPVSLLLFTPLLRIKITMATLGQIKVTLAVSRLEWNYSSRITHTNLHVVGTKCSVHQLAHPQVKMVSSDSRASHYREGLLVMSVCLPTPDYTRGLFGGLW